SSSPPPMAARGSSGSTRSSRWQCSPSVRRCSSPFAADGPAPTSSSRTDAYARLVPPSSFIGRDVELAEGRAVVEAAIGGRGGVLLITGEPGIGKTRLADELAAHAESKGAAVRWASCWEGEGAAA